MGLLWHNRLDALYDIIACFFVNPVVNFGLGFARSESKTKIYYRVKNPGLINNLIVFSVLIASRF